MKRAPFLLLCVEQREGSQCGCSSHSELGTALWASYKDPSPILQRRKLKLSEVMYFGVWLVSGRTWSLELRSPHS